MEMRLLIAEDEADLAEALTVFFEKNHFSVDAVGDGFSAYEYASAGDYDGILLDVMMLTAKAATGDRITGFDAGADDYLPKPFEPDELISRVRAMLRRSGDYKPNILTFGDLSLDPDSGTLSCGEKSVRLSGREFQVMELFMRSPNVVLSADRIMERVWGWDSDAEINVIWVHISNLRKKLKSIGSSVSICANRGLGYLLEVSDD